MAVYTLINGATRAFFTFNTIIPPVTDGPIPQPQISSSQSFQLILTGQAGHNVSATAQVYSSNDGLNWSKYFDPITAMGVGSAIAGWGGSQNWKYFSAQLTSISGSQAQATLTMNG